VGTSGACHRHHRIEATLGVGARQRELDRPVAVLLGPVGHVTIELTLAEPLERLEHLLRRDRVTTRHPNVQTATHDVRRRRPVLDVRGEVGERTVLIGQVDETVDRGAQIVVRVVLGRTKEDRRHRREVSSRTRIAMDPSDLDHLHHADMTSHQRISQLRRLGTHRGQRPPPGRIGRRGVPRRPQVPLHRAMPIHPVHAPMLRHRQPGRLTGLQLAQRQLTHTQLLVQLGVGIRHRFLEQLSEHTGYPTRSYVRYQCLIRLIIR